MSGAVPTPAPAVNCAGCRFYLLRHGVDHTALARARDAGIAIAEGHCRAHPAPVVKAPEEWCGEHQPRLREAR